MAKKRDDGGEPTTTEETTTRVDAPAQATGDKEVRRGLGAPPPGTQGDPTVKPVEPGESG